MAYGKTILRSALQSLCRTLPIYSGAGRIANSWAFSALAGEELTNVRISDGSIVIVDPQDTLGRAILYFGDQDRKVSWVLKSVLRPGDHAVDVGANIGALSIMAARAVGPTGCVISVEPQPDLAARIKASCALNTLTNVMVHQVGLSDTNRMAELSVPGTNSGYGSLLMKYGPEQSGRSVAVALRHAGEFLQEVAGDRRLRLLKIDVEGHEAAVMRGARDWLTKNPADYVLMEIGSGKAFWAREEIRILDEIGYKFLGIPHTMFKVKCGAIDRGSDVSSSDFRDTLAYHKDITQPSALRQ